MLVQSLSGRVLDISERAAAILGSTPTDVGGPAGGRPAGRRWVNEQGLAHEPGGGPRAPVRQSRAPGGPSTPSSSASRCRAPAPRRCAGSRWPPARCPPATATSSCSPTLVDVTGPPRGRGRARPQSETQFRVAMENAPIGMALVDPQWRIVGGQRGVRRAARAPSVGALRGYATCRTSSHPEDRAAERARGRSGCSAARAAPVLAREAVPARRRPDRSGSCSTSCSCGRRPARPTTSSSRCGTSTESRLQSEMLTHRAMHDPLTGLANRTLLQEVLQAVLEQPGVVGPGRGPGVRPRRVQGDQRPVRARRGRRGARARRGRAARGDRAAGGRSRGSAATSSSSSCRTTTPPGPSSRSPPAIHARAAGARSASRRRRLQRRARASASRSPTPSLARRAARRAARRRRRRALPRQGRRVAAAPRSTSASMTMGRARRACTASSLQAIERGQLVLHYQPIVDLADAPRRRATRRSCAGSTRSAGCCCPASFLPLVQEAGLVGRARAARGHAASSSSSPPSTTGRAGCR